MKKILSITICAVILISALVFPASAVITNGRTAEIGDADGDGAVNARDAYSLRAYIAGVSEEIDKTAVDFNDDNEISSPDVFYLKKYLMGETEGLGLTDAQIKKVIIGGYDLSEFSIRYDEGANENVKYAASELKKYVGIATGRDLPIDTETVSTHSFVYATSDELGAEGVDIKVSDGNVYVTGGETRGCLYGTYEFLERYLGFVFINEDYEFNCAKSVVVIDEGANYSLIPTITFRDSMTHSYEGRSIPTVEAALRLKISSIRNRGLIERSEKYGHGEGFIGTAHTMSDFAPHFVKDNATKTDWCPTSLPKYGEWDEDNPPTLLDEVLENICLKIASAKAKGDVCNSISVSPMDNPEFCTCRYCKKINQAEGTTMGSHLTFINLLADELYKIYPDVHVLTTAYWIDRKPPKTIVCRDNVDILFCWSGCNNHPFDGSECYDEGNRMWYSNKLESSYFEKWCQICKKVYVWIYATSYSARLGEPSFLDNIRGDIEYLNSHGVYGIYCEGYYGTDDNFKDGNCFDLLTMYMLAKCMWEPDMSAERYDELENEFIRYYYGAGWESVRTYLDMCSEATDESEKCWCNNCDIVFDCIDFDYIKDNSETIYTLIDAALELAETKDETDHVEHLAASAYWQCLSATYESKYENGTATEKSLYAERYNRLYGWMVNRNITNLDGIVGGFDADRCKTLEDPYYWEGINVYHNLKTAKNPVDVYE